MSYSRSTVSIIEPSKLDFGEVLGEGASASNMINF